MANRKQEESYEDQVLKEFERSQGQTGGDKVVRNIGKVDLTNHHSINDEPEIKRINESISYHNIPLNLLPSKGKYYPEDTKISIRAAKVGEIREFSTIDEKDVKDVTDKMTYILSQCTKVFYGNTPGSYKDIIAADRIVLILKIRELTFTEGSTSIKIPVPSGACKTVGCHPQEHIDFNTSVLKCTEPDELMEKYYDPARRCYNVETKKFGTITLYPPNVGVSTAITDWVVKQQKENRKIEASLAEILQFMIKDWRGLTDKAIFAKLTELSGWTTEKFTLVYRLVEKINVGVEFEITTYCESCGGEIKVPIQFPDGYKSLFVPTISDIGDQLL